MGKLDNDVVTLVFFGVLLVHHSVILSLWPEGVIDRRINEPTCCIHIVRHSLQSFQVNGVDGKFQVIYRQPQIVKKISGFCLGLLAAQEIQVHILLKTVRSIGMAGNGVLIREDKGRRM